MITVEKLRALLSQVPDGATVYAYEEKDVGFEIRLGEKRWWIRAFDSEWEDDYTEGFPCSCPAFQFDQISSVQDEARGETDC